MSQRQDTCIKTCPFWKKYKKNCPNFVEGRWVTHEGHTYETADCAPKRSMILCQQVYDHMLDVRKDYNEVRNISYNVLQATVGLAGTWLPQDKMPLKGLDKSDVVDGQVTMIEE